jgi:hypothetical protein
MYQISNTLLEGAEVIPIPFSYDYLKLYPYQPSAEPELQETPLLDLTMTAVF